MSCKMAHKAFCLTCGRALKKGPKISEIFPWVSDEEYMEGHYSCEEHPQDGCLLQSDFIQKTPKKEGQYFYMYPNWEHPIIVKIIKENSKFYIDFNDNELDLLLDDCDKNVLWYKIGK